MAFRGAFFLVALLLIAACGAQAEGETGGNFNVAGFQFTVPPGWARIPVTGEMRKAELRLRGEKEDASCVFFFFGMDQGGDVKSNVARWAAQFSGAEDQAMMATQDIGQNKLTLMKAQGVFNSSMPGAPAQPRENYAMLGAILEGAEGKVFVKMTGPLAVVKSGEPAFTAMLRTAAAGH